MEEHAHSNEARKIVNTLAIGRLDRFANERVVKIAGLERNANQTGSTKTFRFEIEPSKVDSY